MYEILESYLTDAPIQHPTNDAFKRWPFAQRVAQVIATRRDKSSIVIGINGAWGEGKTSVLNLIQHELSQHSHVVCMKFNPWRFGDEEQLLKGFFFDLAHSIDQSLTTVSEKIGDLLKSLKAFASWFGQGDSVESLGAMLSSADLEELRDRVENILNEQERRVVILVDDIDRLEKSEIHALFRLVKLTADFKNTAYVLAFDFEMVAAALQERYGSGQQNAGKAFLEKIIQVPLQLPAVDKASLRKYCFSGVYEALSQAGIRLREEEAQLFAYHFVNGLEPRLSTPRQAKLYTNILTFSLPILKGEVNIVDLMLIEGIRVFYPNLYDVIRRYTPLFLGNGSENYSRRSEEQKERIQQLVSAALLDLSNPDKKSAQDLLLYLFPRLQSVFGNTHYGSDWDKVWSTEKRICSRFYVNRYFAYTVPKDDISDLLLEVFIENISAMNFDEVTQGIAQIINPNNSETVIYKSRQLTANLSADVSKKLASAIAVSARLFPNPDILFKFSTPFARAAMLVGDLVANLPTKEVRFSFASELVSMAQPITFGYECIRWFKRDKEERPNEKGFRAEEIDELGKQLAKRIIVTEGGLATLITEFKSDVTPLLYTLGRYGDKVEVHQKFRECFDENPENAVHLLLCYLPTTFEMEGHVRKGNFERTAYKVVSYIVDPALIVSALKRIYNDLIYVEQYPESDDIPLELRTAQQFVWLHLNQDSQETSENEASI